MNERLVYPDGAFRLRNHLPHLDVEGGLYFVTFCLSDAIPPGFAAKLGLQRRQFLADTRRRFGTVRPVDLRQIEKRTRKVLFDEMDRGHGRCDLRRPRIAELVTNALRYFDQDRYRLFSYVVMPNHVHAIFLAYEGWPWWKITGSWKSFTARRANAILARTGSFWQDDSFERLIRSVRQLESASRYVVENPVKAGLVGWPWVHRFAPPSCDGPGSEPEVPR